MTKRDDRHIVQVKVGDRFTRSGNCAEVYPTRKEAERAIARHGASYMEYRVRKVCKTPKRKLRGEEH